MKTIKLFQVGQNQTVKLPIEFRISGNEAYIKKVGNNIIFIPINNPWESLFDSLDKFSADYMSERNQPI